MVFLLILNLFFFSLSKAGELESLIDYALKNSPRLKVYQSMIESTKHRETYSKSLPNPSLSVGLNNLPLNRPYPNKYEPMSNLSIGISQMYMLPIKREREALMALKERLALLEEEELLKRELIKDIKLSYLEWLYTFKREDVLNRIKREIDTLYKLAEENYKYGKANLSDLLFLKGEQIKVESELEKVKLERESKKEELDYLVGKRFELKGEEVYFKREEFPEVNLDENLYIKRLKAQREKLVAEVERRKVEYLPDIELMAEYMIRPSMENMFSLRAGVSLPIWKSKREDLLVLEKLEEVKAKDWEIENTRLELRKTLNSLKIEYGRLKEILKWTEELIEEKEKEIKALELAYRYQKADLRDLLRLYRELWELEINRLDVELSIQKIWPRLEVLL
uniref:TolC family protein n=1 Tax=Hydrogenobacter sp. TaxID=2152829 RepID=A0A7C2V4P1_9AQUI